ncbi:MAG: hypothetical protein ABSE40_24040 [Candidatus Sulfotelmatobacter sp.]|jgi:hypothetical protein
MTKPFALFVVLATNLAFAGIHDACHSEDRNARNFGVAYVGAILDLKRDEAVAGKSVYKMRSVNHEQAFMEVCGEIDRHPDLWDRPSREAIVFAVNSLWKNKN